MLNYFSIFKNLKKFSNRKETDKQIFKQEVPLQKPDQSAHILSGYLGSGYLLWREYFRLAASLISYSLLSPIRPGGRTLSPPEKNVPPRYVGKKRIHVPLR